MENLDVELHLSVLKQDVMNSYFIMKGCVHSVKIMLKMNAMFLHNVHYMWILEMNFMII